NGSFVSARPNHLESNLQIWPRTSQRLFNQARLCQRQLATARAENNFLAHDLGFGSAQHRAAKFRRVLPAPLASRNEPATEILDVACDDLLAGGDLFPALRDRLLR